MFVHECETGFGVFPVSDVIDIRKRKFPIACHASCAKKMGRNCLIYCVSTHSLAKVSSMHYD